MTAETPPPQTRPQGSSDTAAAIAALDVLLKEGKAVLSTADRDAPERFHFLLHIEPAPVSGAGASATYWIGRDHKKVVVLLCSEDGLPYCYMTNGLMVILDQKRIGSLSVCESGGPVFSMSADEAATGTVLALDYVREIESGSVMLDIPSLLRAARAKTKDAAIDDTKHVITLRTEHSTISVVLPSAEDHADFAIKSLTIKGATATLSISDIAANTEPHRDAFTITKHSLDQLKLPLRDVNESTLPISLLAPHRFGSDPLEKATAEKLATLFPVSKDNGKAAPSDVPSIKE